MQLHKKNNYMHILPALYIPCFKKKSTHIKINFHTASPILSLPRASSHIALLCKLRFFFSQAREFHFTKMVNHSSFFRCRELSFHNGQHKTKGLTYIMCMPKQKDIMGKSICPYLRHIKIIKLKTSSTIYQPL